MSLLSTLNIGMRGLAASQLAMDITGQNISNSDVEGYSRKRLNLSADYRKDPSLGQIGMGVEIINIERVRSSFIDMQIRGQNQEVGRWEELDNTLESIENIFTEPGDTGLPQFIDQFFDSWQDLTNNPADVSSRTMVKTNAEVLSDTFHNLSNELQKLQITRNDEIADRVAKVNELTKEIYELNVEVASVEIRNQNANDSRDSRDRALTELSKLIDIAIVENEAGQVSVSSGGNLLVSPAYYQKLETTTTSYSLPDGTSYSEIGIRLADSKNIYKPTGGQIKGLIESRDTIIPEYQKKLDALAVALVERVNELHQGGYSLNGYTGITFFDEKTVGASSIGLSASINSNVLNIAAASGGEVHGATQNVLAAGTHDFGGAPIQLYRDPGQAPPTNARNMVDGTVIVSTGTTTLRENVDYHIDYLTGTIQFLHSGFDGDDLRIDFQYRSGGFQGPGDNSNAVAIARLREELSMETDLHGNYTSSFTSYYASFISKLGVSRSESQSSLETRNYLVDQYQSHQDSISGVSVDEEMANLVKFQHTYQAAARLISITDEMLDVLMNM